jgi:lipopolysaccharide transport system ATP-binding protein
MSTVIDVDDVWKKYRLGIIGTGMLRHDFERWWHRVRGKPDPYSKVDQRPEIRNRKSELATNVDHRISGVSASLGDDEVWALRGVSFEVKQGEILGIIGRNGAGKSTLLKILSRVTAPTRGEARVKGRIASLLEVGTGFHPELTGRENVFLNGAVLGMTKAEIRKKFDEIVAFAGVERYMDTPVKRYSSGMYVRLAFAVAAHLDPEILIVDEVLAVGDAEFQKKCLGKMSSVSRGGRTILFVSHNLDAIKNLCERTIWVDQGMIVCEGETRDVVARYLGSSRSTKQTWTRDGPDASDSPIVLDAIRVTSARSNQSGLHFDEPIAVEIRYRVTREAKNVTVRVRVFDANGLIMFTSWDTDTTASLETLRQRGEYSCCCTIPRYLLRPGKYDVTVSVVERDGRAWVALDRVVSFEVTEVGFRLDRARMGVITPILDWNTTRLK